MYNKFAELISDKKEDIHFKRHWEDRESEIILIAPHAGGIEPGTGKLAEEIAATDLSFYIFEGIQKKDNQSLHILSTRFNDPCCLDIVSRSQYAIALHGCQGNQQTIFVGGKNLALRQILINNLIETGFAARIDDTSHKGTFDSNICNRCSSGAGVQIELTETFRKTLFRSLDRRGREYPREAFYSFSSIVRTTCLDFVSENAACR